MRPAARRTRDRSSPSRRAASSRRTRRRVPARRRTSSWPSGSVTSSATLRFPRPASGTGSTARRRRSRACSAVGVRERRQAPARRRARRLDRDHLGAHRREEERAQRAGDEPADVEHAHAGQAARAIPGFGVAHAVGASSRSRWRSTNFCTLPLGVRGNSSTARTSSGHFCRASPRRSRCVADRGEIGRGVAGQHAEERARRSRRAAASGAATTATSATSGMRTSMLLDLGRAHVLAAADDDVLLAVGDREVAVGVEHADVAGHEPAVGANAAAVSGGIGVADEAVGPAAPDLARLARAPTSLPSSSTRRISTPGSGAPSVCSRFSRGDSAVQPGDRRVLGRAEAARGLDAELLGALADRGRHRGAAEPDRTASARRARAGSKSGWSSRLVRKNVAPWPADRPSSSIAASTRAGSHTSMRWIGCAPVHGHAAARRACRCRGRPARR